MELESIKLSEIIWTQRVQHCVKSLICTIRTLCSLTQRGDRWLWGRWGGVNGQWWLKGRDFRFEGEQFWRSNVQQGDYSQQHCITCLGFAKRLDHTQEKVTVWGGGYVNYLDCSDHFVIRVCVYIWTCQCVCVCVYVYRCIDAYDVYVKSSPIHLKNSPSSSKCIHFVCIFRR